ncbi:hypothetical protein COT30_03165 [Candidatus Micrarchaeota archaeon CG08_land_8_20_14_0_20_49_17]|nr:MAG: hypothetical protein COT30_03165 [Candidatus Micrarchaeota archaeon CG08_land_8_20_14_0_20_49_17]HII53755.1 helix-turn-helix domain-containing protein [Candidatus Micrarchaeota archaeon]
MEKKFKNKRKESSAMRAYKFRLYPSKAQAKELQEQLWLSKQLWNELLS